MDVQADLSLCWSHKSYYRFCYGLAPYWNILVARWLVLPTLDQEVPGSNPDVGWTQHMTIGHFIAQSLSLSPSHHFDITVKSLLYAQALINAHPPIWMLKMAIFFDNSLKITASIKRPLAKKKKTLPYAESFQICCLIAERKNLFLLWSKFNRKYREFPVLRLEQKSLLQRSNFGSDMNNTAVLVQLCQRLT